MAESATNTASSTQAPAALVPGGEGAPIWFQTTAADALHLLGTTDGGLTAAEATARLAQYGPNELVERSGRSPWSILLEQFTNILTLLLIAASLVSAFLGDWIEAVVILIIVILNGVLGFTQEYRAEQSMAALKKMSVPTVRVRRGGRTLDVDASSLVPGDVVILETGNVVPADGRVLRSLNMRAMEAALTGESEAVEKDPTLVFDTSLPLGDRRNMVYAGTIINYGRGEMLVTGTGMQTELGNIATMLQDVIEEATPLQQRLDKLGKWLAIGAIALVVIIFVGGIVLGQGFEKMLLTAVSLAVAAIPEALTAVVTIALSLGAQRMLQRKALIRQLHAVETLGSVTVICSDKTGTLTQNRMSVTALDVANHSLELRQAEDSGGMRLVRVSGPEAGAAPGDDLLPTLDLLLVAGSLCNDAVLERSDHRKASASDVALSGSHWYAVGDPTEGAIILAAAEYGVLKYELEAAFPRIDELPFDSTRKRMTTIHTMPTDESVIPEGLRAVWDRRVNTGDASHVAFTKGAVDSLLECSTSVWIEGVQAPMDDVHRRQIMEANNRLAAQGKRVLGVAVRTLDHVPNKQEVQQIESDLILVGLYGMIDPPRPEVREAVLTCRSAGIRPVMITGDHPLTARHIAQQVGITDARPGEEAPYLTGQDIDALSPEALRERARDVQVFARVSPEHKLSLIEIYQEQGNIVAMTGDGVNDAPALKKADIGVAMGITGTDVSKEAANMVLLDDNFATIVAAVEEGRVVYDNIRKFIQYLLTCNASEIAVMLLWPAAALLFGIQLGADATIALLPLQILWMNLVTDGLPALALGVEKAERNVMRRPPYSSEESIFGRGMLPFIAVFGVVMSIIAIAVGLWDFHRDPTGPWQTLLFTTLIFNQVMLALGLRSIEQSLFSIGLFSNPSMVAAFLSTVLLQLMVIYVPFFQGIFKTQALGFVEVLIALGMGVLVLLCVELWKWFLRRRMAANH